MIRRIALAPLVAALCCAPVFAEEEPKDESGIEVTVKSEERKRGKRTRIYSTFSITGKTRPLPPGTRLHVTLRAKGKTRDVVCALFRIPVMNNTIKGGKRWINKTFGPLVYETRVELLVHKQSPANQRWIRREYGFPAEHRELLFSKQVEVGTAEQRVEFAQNNLKTLHTLLKDLKDLRDEVEKQVSTPAKGNPKWPKKLDELNTKVMLWRRSFETFKRKWVVLLEQGYLNTLLNLLKEVARAVQDHGSGRPIMSNVQQVGEELKRIEASLMARMPIDPQADDEGGK